VSDRATDLLARPAAQSVRLIALGYLEDATQALERTNDPADEEALHDFRVAVRRLRTTLRAYRPLLDDGVGRKTRKQLSQVADTTNRLREAEVALEWLRPLETGMTHGERVGLAWLIERVAQQRAKDLEENFGDIRETFTTAAHRLHKGLVSYEQSVGTEPSATDVAFAVAVRAAAVEQAKALDELLGAVHRIDDDAAHRARIAAKRLRYVLEPVKAALTGGPELIKRLKRIQDLIGELHDLQELEALLREAAGTAAAERAAQLLEAAIASAPSVGRRSRRPGKQAGLVAIGKRARLRQAELFEQLRKDWLGVHRTWERDAAALQPAVTPAAAAPAAAPAAVPVPVPVPVPTARRWAGGRSGSD